MAGIDLEGLKKIFEDKRQHIAIATISKIVLAEDKSHLKCLVSVFPEQRELIARMTWESVGPDSGIFAFPVPGDLVLVAFADGDENQLFVIKRLTSKVDKIPVQAVTGDTAIVALAEKNVWITGKKTYISGGAAVPTEPLVLGNELKTLLSALIEKVADLSDKVGKHTHAGNLGFPTSPPNQAADFATLKSFFTEKKSDPVDSGKILSDISFTEKGS